MEQELSQSTVSSIVQDDKGFMWFGTWDGLNRYDGYNFTVFRHDPDDPDSLSSSNIAFLFEDRGGALWMGTDNGLNRLDRTEGKFIRYQHDPDHPDSLSNNEVTSFFDDRTGVMWVGTKNGLNRLERQTETFVRYQNNPDDPNSLSHNSVSCVYEDRTATLWVGTESGLNRLNRKQQKLKTETFTHFRNDSADPRSLSHNSISCVYEDHAGALWIGTKGGLNRFDREREIFTRYQHDPADPRSLSSDEISCLFEDRSGTLWIGTDRGLNKFDREKEKFVRYQNDPADIHSLSHDVVMSLFGDRSGVIWVGTYTGGLSKFDLETKKFVHYRTNSDIPESLSHNVVWAISEDRPGLFWIGTDRGLNRFDQEAEKFTHYRHDETDPHSLGNDEIWSVLRDSSGLLWVGTKSGLNAFDRKTETFTRYQINSDPDDSDYADENKIKAILEDRTGFLWIGTSGGLNRFNRDSGIFTPYKNIPDDPLSLSNDTVWAICEDGDGKLWIGTENGLNQFDRGNETFIRYQADDGLSNSWILSICEDSEGMLWLGTVGGLNKFDRRQKTFTHYREKDGLPNDVVYGVLEDDHGNLWISTNKGISKFNPKTETFTNYNSKDGLQSNEFNVGACFKSSAGEMFFGGINGFNVFHPGDIQDNPHIPPILITNFQIGESSDMNFSLKKFVTETNEVMLSHKDKVLSFEFVALHYSSPRKNLYAYMMEGFDRDWIDSGTRRFARYTNLPPGEYVFRVKGSNNDGVWNEQGNSILFIMPPPPWKTWWAYSFYILLVIFALQCAVRHKRKMDAKVLDDYRRELEKKQELARYLEQKVEERTRELNKTLEKVEEANTKIMDSIQYAKMIQDSLLPNPDEVANYLPDNFFIWMPRDIVGGDIFFADFFDDSARGSGRGFVVAVMDCTGHGVPGAFMTMIASSGLRRIITDEGCRDPADALKRLNFIVKTSLQQDTKYALSDDGLDAAICFVHFSQSRTEGTGNKSQIITFAGAKLSLVYIHNGELHAIKGDKQSLGYKPSRRSNIDFCFTKHVIPIKKGMTFYMYTDGFVDQLGGQREMPFGTRRLRNTLKENVHLPFDKQKEILLKAFEEHKGEHERQDDVTVIGFNVRDRKTGGYSDKPKT